MKASTRLACLFLASLTAAAQSALAQVSLEIVPSIAPNRDNSAYWSTWESNAISALYTGATTAGTLGTPGYYSAITGPVDTSNVYVTTFPSWLGVADPATVFGPAYAAEYGNRLTFGFIATDSNGQQFSISQISLSISADDSRLNYTWAAGSFTYSSGYVGILFGADGKMGGGDDTFITSGANTQLVDAVISRGPGNAYWPEHATSGDSLTDQQVIDAFRNAQSVPATQLVTASATIDLGGGQTATASATTVLVPEPSTYAAVLGALCLAGAVLRRQRRK